jgi:uncharacterized membrane protein
MKLLGHPIHPIIVVFPLGLLSTAVIFDLLYLVAEAPAFIPVAFYLILAGIVSGLIAELFGLIDWLQMKKGTRAKNVGFWHGLGNAVLVGLFTGSLLFRQTPSAAPDTTALIFSFTGGALLLLTGWLGGEMVYRMGVAVEPGAHENSPNSLSGKPAKAKR